MPYPTDRERDRPWVIRTYAGHSSAAKSNELYRRNLAKGQTGLSVAFDLPTQTGYDPDDELARGEVGKVGVPISHLGDMRTLFDGIPLAEANTSMTINAPAMWLLALYVAVAEEQGADRAATGRDDAERHRQGVPVAGHLRLPARAQHAADHRHDRLVGTPTSRSGTRSTSAATTCRRPGRPRRRSWPTRCRRRSPCSTPCATPGRSPPRSSARSSGASRSSSTPGSGSSRRCARCAPSPSSGTRSRASATASRTAKHARLRYGVQVNSLGLTEAQPENNVQRIVLEMLAVTLSRDARARAIQLPAWNEALGLPRPWDQQWALRMQQVLAYETDLLEYEDLFDGSRVVEAKVAELVEGARVEIDRVQEMGGAVAAVESGYMKGAAGALAGRRGGGGSSPATTSSSASTGSRPPSPARCRPTGPVRSRSSTRRWSTPRSRRSARGGPGATRPRWSRRWTTCATPP